MIGTDCTLSFFSAAAINQLTVKSRFSINKSDLYQHFVYFNTIISHLRSYVILYNIDLAAVAVRAQYKGRNLQFQFLK